MRSKGGENARSPTGRISVSLLLLSSTPHRRQWAQCCAVGQQEHICPSRLRCCSSRSGHGDCAGDLRFGAEPRAAGGRPRALAAQRRGCVADPIDSGGRCARCRRFCTGGRRGIKGTRKGATETKSGGAAVGAFRTPRRAPVLSAGRASALHCALRLRLEVCTEPRVAHRTEVMRRKAKHASLTMTAPSASLC